MFLDPKNIGFDVLLTYLLILDFLGGHLGSHLELQLFWTIFGISTQVILNLLGVPNEDQESKLGDIFRTQDTQVFSNLLHVSYMDRESKLGGIYLYT